MMLAAFDLEIAKEIPEDAPDWKEHRPLGISCAHVLGSGKLDIAWDSRWAHDLRLPKRTCRYMVASMVNLVEQGYTLVTWNGLGFDFDVLAEESGERYWCAELARNHVDLMFIVVALRGHYLGLDTAAKGMGIEGKMKQVTLNDGTPLDGMSGAKAPELWAGGEFDAVRAYLAEDVRVTLELAEAIKQTGSIRWIARSGRPNRIDVTRLYTVAECLVLPEPDTSWMTDPPLRRDFCAWMSKEASDAT